jgi:hypothetical protein
VHQAVIVAEDQRFEPPQQHLLQKRETVLACEHAADQDEQFAKQRHAPVLAFEVDHLLLGVRGPQGLLRDFGGGQDAVQEALALLRVEGTDEDVEASDGFRHVPTAPGASGPATS